MAEHDLAVLRVDLELATSKVEKINKARMEAETRAKERGERLTKLEAKIKDKEDVLVRQQRKLAEHEDRLLEFEKSSTQLEKDKANMRIESD